MDWPTIQPCICSYIVHDDDDDDDDEIDDWDNSDVWCCDIGNWLISVNKDGEDRLSFWQWSWCWCWIWQW